MERKLIELYRQLHDNGAFFFERKMPVSFDDKKSAVIKIEDDFAVFMDTEKVETIAEETELVAHECGHVETGSTHSVCSPYDLVEKHELKANKWAVHRIFPPAEIRQIIRDGYSEPWEIAEHAGRTEEFVQLALDIYRSEGIEFSTEVSEGFPRLWVSGM